MSDNIVAAKAACVSACIVCQAARLVAGAVLRTALEPATRAEGAVLYADALACINARIAQHQRTADDFAV